MDNTTQNFSPEESIRLIQSMIDKTRQNVTENSRYFLLWGWSTFAVMISQFLLSAVFHSPYSGNVWLVMLPCPLITWYWISKDSANRRTKSYVNESMWYLWTAIALAFCSASVIFIKLSWQNCFPVFMVLHSVGIYISGRILQFRFFVWGAIVSFILAAIAIWFPFDYQNLFAAAAVMISYIIPGHLLRSQYKKAAYEVKAAS
jgi:hypothetical protein